MARLAIGLRADSRIKSKIFGIHKELPQNYILAAIADLLSAYIAQSHKKSLGFVNSMLDKSDTRKTEDSSTELFSAGKDFEERRKSILKGSERKCQDQQ